MRQRSVAQALYVLRRMNMTLSALLRQGIVRRNVSIRELDRGAPSMPNLDLDLEEAWPRLKPKPVVVDESEVTKVYRYTDLELLASKP